MTISNVPGGMTFRWPEGTLPGDLAIDPTKPDELPSALRPLAGSIKRFLDDNPDYGDTVDTIGELNALRKHLEKLLGTQAKTPGIPNADGVTADMLEALINWIASGGKARESASAANGSDRSTGHVPSLGGAGSFSSRQPTSWRPSPNSASFKPSASPAAPTSPGETQSVEQMKARTPPDIRERAEAVDPSQIAHYAKRSPKAQWAARVAVAMGLQVTDVTDGHPGDGIHSNASLHYDENDANGRIRAIDVGGSASQMGAFYDVMRQIDPGATELFYDPRGGIKHGREIGPIGGHGDHVHYGTE